MICGRPWRLRRERFRRVSALPSTLMVLRTSGMKRPRGHWWRLHSGRRSHTEQFWFTRGLQPPFRKKKRHWFQRWPVWVRWLPPMQNSMRRPARRHRNYRAFSRSPASWVQRGSWSSSCKRRWCARPIFLVSSVASSVFSRATPSTFDGELSAAARGRLTFLFTRAPRCAS